MHRYQTPEAREAFFRQAFRQAREHVGTTPADQARWLLELGYQQVNFEKLTKANVLALRWELEVFLRPTPDPGLGPTVAVREDKARHWLGGIRDGVQNLAKGKAWSHALVTHHNFWIPRIGQQAGRRCLSPGRITPKKPDVLHTSKTTKEPMAHKICDVLAAVGDRLRRCQRTMCGRLFVAHKRQRYCTPACGWVTRTRRHRSKQRRAGVSGNI
jgi:hypothetical protein